jgi:hypothetical protein
MQGHSQAMKSRLTITIALILAALATRPASASPFSLALDITGNTTSGFFGSSGTAGWSFQVTTPLYLYGIGFFDPGSLSSLGTPVVVGLWDGAGNLLASGDLTNTTNDTVIPSTDCCGEWLFDTNGSPIETLAPGSYVIGAFVPETQVFIAAATTAPTFPGITYGENLQITGAGLAEPNFTDAPFGLAFFGPNLLVGAIPASIPAPATFPLISGALLLISAARYSPVRKRGQ